APPDRVPEPALEQDLPRSKRRPVRPFGGSEPRGRWRRRRYAPAQALLVALDVLPEDGAGRIAGERRGQHGGEQRDADERRAELAPHATHDGCLRSRICSRPRTPSGYSAEPSHSVPPCPADS